jgi:hypothetical protein
MIKVQGSFCTKMAEKTFQILMAMTNINVLGLQLVDSHYRKWNSADLMMTEP